MARNYAALMEESRELLRTRMNLPRAASLAEEAASKAPGMQDFVRASQRAGICYRLLRQHGQAEAIFRQAIAEQRKVLQQQPFHSNLSLLADLLRDASMVHLDRRCADDLAQAHALLEESLALALSSHNQVSWLNSLGFSGRYDLWTGNRNQAKNKLRHVYHAHLDHGRTEFALNALVWLLKAVEWRERYPLMRVGIQLAQTERNRKRMVEIIILGIGGWPLHRAFDFLRRLNST